MKEVDLIKLIDLSRKIITELFFNGQEPAWLSMAVNYFLLIALTLLVLWGLLIIISQIVKIWAEQIIPLYYDQKQKRRLLNRQRFAIHIEQEIRQLNSREEWKDYRFTELEAEVEAEGKRVRFPLLPFLRSTRRGLRREQSLSKALELSDERLILLEGDPGSGKSIALRHVAEKLAKQSSKDKNIQSIIPLYVNLKKLEREPDSAISRELIESFAKQELNRINDRDIEQFLDEEFQNGLKEGTWLFLFDSFDELPEVLSSVEADATIRDYAQAIDDFLSGFNKCRGIIASRQFRGPKHLGWPHFRILPLDSRRWELIRKADLDPRIEKELSGRLRVAAQEIQEMTKNPMFLGILCEDMRDGNDFPKNSHGVFENYLKTRLTRDAERLQKRFHLQPAEVRAAAERIAFCMSIDSGVGLSPARDKIREAMDRHHLDSEDNLEQYMNALEYLKLARSEVQTLPGDAQFFTFAHRRFQEYFATCIVLSDLTRISPRQLLTDGRWRETAVVILQTQSPENFAPILAEASCLLQEMTRRIPDLIDDPHHYINTGASSEIPSALQSFVWPAGLLPLFSLLQDGLMGRMQELPDNIQVNASRILLTASSEGNLLDQKWSLEVAGITPQPVLLWLLRRAFDSESQWLKEIAYRQTARLGRIPDDIAAAIRNSLTYLFHQHRLNKEYYTTFAHLSRLDQPSRFTNSLRLLKLVPAADTTLKGGVLLGLIALGSVFYWNDVSFSLVFAFLVFIVLEMLLYNQKSYPFIAKYFENFALVFRVLFIPLLWVPFAITASEQGLFTSPIWWPFLVFLPALYLIFDFNRTSKLICSSINNNKKHIIAFICSYSILILLLLLFPRLPQALKSIPCFIIISYLLISVYLIYWIYKITIAAYFWQVDILKFKKWLKIPLKPVTAEELLHLLSQYQTPECSKKLIVVIHEKNVLSISEDSENLISELALTLESTMRSKPLPDEFIASELFRKWMEQYTRKNKLRLVSLGQEFLDEIYIMLKQVRSKV